MRYTLVLTAAALLAPASAVAADPPITFQTHAVERVLDDLRGAADMIGGEKAVKAVNTAIKDKLGEKGFEGLDLAKPVVGYVILAPKLEDTVAVVAFPFTTEKEFLALCDRWNGGEKAKDLGKGLYELPPLEPFAKARMRFAEGYAYIAAGKDPEPALEAKSLVSPTKLYDPAERAVFAGKLHFERIPAEVKKAIPGYLADIKKELEDHGDVWLVKALKPALPDIEKMLTRYVILLGGADALTLRMGLDVPKSDLVIEATLTPKPDTLLAKVLAAQKPTENRFGALLTPDTAVGFKVRLPFFNDELKAAGTKILEELQKEANKPEAAKDLTDELFKGLTRTIKTGEADIVVGIRGPDKDGDCTLVGAVAFEDTAALEKEFKKYVEKTAPADEQERFKWDAAKAGNVTIHTYKLPTGGFFDISKPFGGEKALLAFAFAPKGVFIVIGPDPIPVMKTALTVKPAEAPALDIVINPLRLGKLVERSGGMALDVEQRFGKEDKLISALSLRASAGKDLTVRLAINLRLLPRALVFDELEGAKVPPQEDKK
jgi:hypothetical protein